MVNGYTRRSHGVASEGARQVSGAVFLAGSRKRQRPAEENPQIRNSTETDSDVENVDKCNEAIAPPPPKKQRSQGNKKSGAPSSRENPPRRSLRLVDEVEKPTEPAESRDIPSKAPAKHRKSVGASTSQVIKDKGDIPKKGRPSKGLTARKELKQVKEEGETYRLDDDVMLILDDKKYQDYCSDDLSADIEPVCTICGKDTGEDLVECDYCLKDYHIKCLPKKSAKPSPDSEWMCPACSRGETVTPESFTSHTELFMYAPGTVGVGKIKKIYSENGKKYITVSEYMRPSEEDLDAKPIARQIVLTDGFADYPVLHLLRKVCVVNSRDALDNAEEDDVFLCDTRYNSEDKIYEPLNPESESDKSEESGSDNEEEFDNDSDCENKESNSGQAQKNKQVSTPKKRGKQQGGRALDETVDENLAGSPSSTRSEEESPASAVQRMLTIAERPNCLPCRDSEKEKINNFLVDVLKPKGRKSSVEEGNQDSSCLYIAGIPGTGKTACVSEVLRDLQAREDIPEFKHVFINALYMTSPTQFYPRLFQTLKGHKLGVNAAMQALDQQFNATKRAKMVTVLVVDEIDMLANREQSVLYNLFSWPHNPNARLAVIGIANTLDLPNRLLPKIRSRMGEKKVEFGPYTKDQIIQIINDRLSDWPHVIQPRAIDFVARRVASVSGDVRRALNILRHAVSLWHSDASDDGEVTMATAKKATSAVFDATHMRAMKEMAPMEMVVLASLLLEARFTDTACDLSSIAARASVLLRCRPAKAVCSNGGATREGPAVAAARAADTLLPPSGLFSAVSHLASSGLVTVRNPGSLWSQLVRINVPVDDAMHVLQESPKIDWMSSVLGAAKCPNQA